MRRNSFPKIGFELESGARRSAGAGERELDGLRGQGVREDPDAGG